ncbi:hypothetical protein L596_001765 [Steinernema carpocapsae]|uniref:Uncharacterized protein n=1 Tax=Steinernema carpocapsae TaxID=34508 RepID=A0A4U8UN76_STECR|nr:hypothetical protein L596_001765 [Steinernema carpocapsae]
MVRSIQSEHNLKRFAGSSLKLHWDIDLHDGSFEYLGFVEDYTIQLKKENVVLSYLDAIYYKVHAVSWMQSEMRFVD